MNGVHKQFVTERLSEIVDRMKEISFDIERKVEVLDADVITTRNDPKIKALWNNLCLLHMKSIIICEENYENITPDDCNFIYQPQACH